MARRVAEAWLEQSWAPTIPDWVFSRFGSDDREALRPGDNDLLLAAKKLIGENLPYLTRLLQRTMGERYHTNSSTRQNELYYFFSPRQPLNTFTLYVKPIHNKVLLVLGYMPMPEGKPDLARSIEVREESDLPMCGAMMLRLAQALLGRVKQSPMQFERTQPMMRYQA